MTASAETIDFTDHNVQFDPGGPDPSVSRLTVDFKVFRRGPTHVCGLIYTTNFWVDRLTSFARFQHFDGDFEIWQAETSASGPIGQRPTFEYLIFCYDHRDINTIRKIYNNNSGETFRI
jgi:hypothetical protein